MPVPSKMADLFTIAASNSPAGSDLIGNSLDDYLRAGFAILRSTNALASASIAAASTTDLSTADGESVQITGSATINSLGTAVPGLIRECRFSGSCVLTNSAAIVLPGSINITTNANDVITFRSLGSGNWAFVSGTNGAFLPLTGGTLTGTMNGTNVSLTGSVGASAFTVAAGSTQGSQILWNNISAGQGRTEFINNYGSGTGGYTWYVRSSTAGGTTQALGLDASGNLTSAGNLVSTAGNVLGSSTVLTLQPSSAGTVYLRPGGNGVSTNQSTFTTSLASIGSNLETTGGLHVSAGTTAFNGQGGYQGWNRTGSQGEVDFINHHGGGAGGWYFYDTNGTTYTQVSTLSPGGTWTAVDFTATSDKRLKKRIRPKVVNNHLADMLELCTWLWKKTDAPGQGLIAQRVLEVAPEYVVKGQDGMLSIDKAGIALECVIGLAARVRELEAD